jgi:hypothetical protein
MRGSILLTFNEEIDNLGIDNIIINVAGQERYIRYIDSDTIYTTLVNTGDVVSITINFLPSLLNKQISTTRRDYTTDDQSGDNGIRDTFISTISGTLSPINLTFTATTVADAYNYEYRVDASTNGLAYNLMTEDSEDILTENNLNIIIQQNLV